MLVMIVRITISSKFTHSLSTMKIVIQKKELVYGPKLPQTDLNV